jgi:Tol biopolymer transport system component
MGRWGVGRLALAATICAGAFATGCEPAPTEGWRSELASTGLTGAPATSQAVPLDITADGTRVLIAGRSTALGFPSVGTPAFADLFMRDLRTGELIRITSTPDGTSGGNGGLNGASFSSDGTSVVFVSGASNLGPPDTNLQLDVYTYDIGSREIALVSTNASGTASGNGQSHSASFSPDGNQIVFTSQATDLGPPDTNNTWDVYVRDLTAGETRLVSANSLGTGPGDLESVLQPASAGSPFSADGRFVLFLSNSGNLTTDPPGGRNAFVRDLVAGSTERATLTDAGQSLPGGAGAFSGTISPSGSLVAFTALVSDSSVPPPSPPFRLDLYVRDLAADTLTQLPATGAGDLVFSPDGRTFAFTTTSPVDTGLPDTNGQSDVHLYDVAARRLRLTSVDATGTRAAAGPSQSPAYSRDGRSLTFVSSAPDLVSGTTGPSTDLYLRSLDDESTTLVSVDRAGTGRAGLVTGRGHVSSDGRVIAYASSSQTLAGVPVPQGIPQTYVARLTPFPRADLAMVSAESPAQVAPGEPWSITATAENRGPDAATHVSVTVLVPAGVGAVAVESEPGATCTTSPGGPGGQLQIVVCVAESLPVGETLGVTVSGTTPDVVAGTELVAIAGVSASRVVDPVGNNGTIVTTSTVVDSGPATPPTTTTG